MGGLGRQASGTCPGCREGSSVGLGSASDGEIDHDSEIACCFAEADTDVAWMAKPQHPTVLKCRGQCLCHQQTRAAKARSNRSSVIEEWPCIEHLEHVRIG